jgi:hypothetical protein
MLTQLPIFYFKKSFPSVIHDRIASYEKAYPFKTKDNIYDLMREKKQDFFYTIHPIVYFPDYWNSYFTNTSCDLTSNISNKKKNIVIVLSKIFTSNEPFSYTKKRSIYTPYERFIQTLEGIESIKKYIENPHILFFDNSSFDDYKYMYDTIQNQVDEFINITDNTELNHYTDYYPYKAFGEIAQMLELYKVRLKFFDYSNIMNVFKITGRYTINNTFDNTIFMKNTNICKINENVTDREYWYTSFYKIHSSFVNTFFAKLKNCFDKKEEYTGKDLENIYSQIFANEFEFVGNLGITQNLAVWEEKSCI